MKFKHVKSPCCGARIRGFGPRRRQCVQCLRTWTIRPQKRGRPPHRIDKSLLRKVLVDGFTLDQLHTGRSKVDLPAFRHRFRQALRSLVNGPSTQKIPQGPLALLVDGLWFQFEKKPWILYLMAVKACCGTHIVFLDPILLPGREGAFSWQKAVATIPVQILSRIHALVADNLPGMQKMSRENDWKLQLCHFHLLMKLMAVRRGMRYALRGGLAREEVNTLVRVALTSPDLKCLKMTLARLEAILQVGCGTKRIDASVGEFLKTYKYYRTYLKYPELNLPHTTNAVESMCRIIREMFRSSRAGSNPKSVQLWATALIRMRPEITCNGHPINRII
jgi:hypothetical protein